MVVQLRGAYKAGYIDLEWLKPNSHEDDTIGFRLHYPLSNESFLSTANNSQQLSSWIPSFHYNHGYVDFIGLPNYACIGTYLFDVFISRSVKMHCHGFDVSHSLLSDADLMPVLIFSHGLGGMRTTYSSIILEYVSHGWIVVALEHRDGSASATLTKEKGLIKYKKPSADLTLEELHKLRNIQLLKRGEEVQRSIDMISCLQSGDLSGFKDVSYLFTSKQQKADGHNFLYSFQGRISLDSIVVGGHSFGAATALLSTSGQCSPFKCVLALDPWMFPFSKDFTRTLSKATPTLIINSADFHWAENLQSLQDYLEKCAQIKGQSGSISSSALKTKSFIMVTLSDTKHQNQSDFPIVIPSLINRFVKVAGSANPIKVIQMNQDLCLWFSKKHILAEMKQEEEFEEEEMPHAQDESVITINKCF